MEQRHHAEHPLALRLAGLHGVRDGRGALRPVRARDTLRPAGGAGRVEHDGERVLGRRRARWGAGRPFGLGVQFGGGAQRHVTGVPRGRDGPVGLRVVGDREDGAGVTEAVAQLVDPEAGGQRHRDRTERLRGQDQRRLRLAPGQRQRHPVAGPGSGRPQRGRQRVHPGAPGGVGEPPSVAGHGDPVRMPFGGPPKCGREIHVSPSYRLKQTIRTATWRRKGQIRCRPWPCDCPRRPTSCSA